MKIYFLALLCCGVASVAFSQPTRRPSARLPVHATDQETRELAAEAYQLLDATHPLREQVTELVQVGKAEKIPAKQLGREARQARQAYWIGHQLSSMGEIAGLDIVFRHTEYYAALKKATQSYRSTTPGKRFNQKLDKLIARTKTKRQKTATRIEKQIQNDQITQAETALIKALLGEEPISIFMLKGSRNPVIYPYRDAIKRLDRQTKAIRWDETVAKMDERIDATLPNLNTILPKAKAAIQTIASGGLVTLDDQLADGLDTFDYFNDQWKIAHAKWLQSYGMHLLRASQTGYSKNQKNDVPSSTSSKKFWSDKISEMSTQFSQVLAAIIDADTKQIPISKVNRRYAQYLERIAVLEPQIANSVLLENCHPMLNRLLEKDSTTQQDAIAYASATNDLLRWRKRTSQQQHMRLKKERRTLPSLTYNATYDRSNYTGLFRAPTPLNRNFAATPALRASATSILNGALDRLVDQPVIIPNVFRAKANGNMAVSAFHQRTYAAIPIPDQLDEMTSVLLTDLLVDDDHPPLTLNAATAITSAKTARFTQIGGTVADVRLEGLLKRLISTTKGTAALFPRGHLPKVQPARNNVPEMVVRFRITPQWFQHDYFVITVK